MEGIRIFLLSVYFVYGVIVENYNAGIDIHGMYFISENKGIISGKNGAILVTKDGGKNFNAVNTGIDILLTAVGGSDSNIWAIGELGTILFSDNNGNSWERQFSPVGYHLLNLFALDRMNVWIVGDWGTIIKTEDGGRNWIDISLKEDFKKSILSEGVVFEDIFEPKTGKIVFKRGEIISKEALSKIDSKTMIKTRFDIILNDVFFIDRDTGWVAGEGGSLFITRDGGKNFIRINISENKVEDDFVSPSLYSIYFFNNGKGYAGGLHGGFYEIMDWGKVRKRVNIGTESDIYSIGYVQF